MNSLTTFFVFTNSLGGALRAALPSTIIGTATSKI